MRKTIPLLALLVTIAFSLVYLDVAFAGRPPRSPPHGQYGDDPEECAICHQVHTALGDGLLILTTDEELCYTCHSPREERTHSSKVTKSEKFLFDFRCVDCHDPHAKTFNSSLIYDEIDGRPVRFHRSQGEDSFADGESFTAVCETCHTQTKYHRRDHSRPSHFDGQYCTDKCHLHERGFGIGGCGCHGTPPPSSAPGYSTFDDSLTPHLKHAGKEGQQYAFPCEKCHNNFDSSHMDGNYQDVYFDASTAPRNPSGVYSPATYLCSNLYCHSNGNPRNESLVYRNPTWGEGFTLNCNGCHGGDDGTGDVSSLTTNSHSKHLTTGLPTLVPPYGARGATSIGCYECHSTRVTDDDNGQLATIVGHVDEVKDVAMDPTDVMGQAGSPTFDSGSGQCSVLCHSDGYSSHDPAGGSTAAQRVPAFYASPVWGQAATGVCGTCHLVAAAGAPWADMLKSFSHDEHFTDTTFSPLIGSCTLACHTTSSAAEHVNGQVNFNDGNLLSATTVCRQCHNDGQDRRISCPTPATYVSNLNWYDPDTGACGTCHEASANLSTVAHSKHLTTTVVAYNPRIDGNCATCHWTGDYVGLGIHANGTVEFSGTTPITYTPAVTAVCQARCHNDGVGSREGGGTAGPPLTQPNWCTPTTGTCGNCHSLDPAQLTGKHDQHFNAAYGPQMVSCTDCHPNPVTWGSGFPPHPDGRVEFRDLNLLSTTTACDECHSTASVDPDGPGPLPATTGAAAAKAGWYDNSFRSTSNYCLYCHNSTDAANSWWDGTGVDAPPHDANWFTTGHGLTGAAYPVSGNPAASGLCRNCHDDTSTHITFVLNDSDRLLAAGDAVCTPCHGSGGSATRLVTTHSNIGYTKTPSETLFSVGCADCHDAHGTSNIYMINVTNTVGMIPTAAFAGDVTFTAVTGADSFDENGADPTDADDICVTCHINPFNPGYPMVRHAGGDHSPGAPGDQRNNNCTVGGCHLHDADGNFGTDDGFMPDDWPWPSPSFSVVSPTIVGQAVVFTNTSRSAIAFAWDFGDGTITEAVAPVHVYQAVGTFTAVLTAANPAGHISTTAKLVSVVPDPCPATDFATNSPVAWDAPLLITNTTVGAVGYQWDLGDGTITDTVSPAYTYGVTGTYTVVLTATSGTGCVRTAQQSVVAGLSCPQPAFVTDSPVCLGQPLLITNTTVGAVGYQWDLGDGTITDTVSPVYTYGVTGTYTVALTATSPSGCVVAARQAVTVAACLPSAGSQPTPGPTLEPTSAPALTPTPNPAPTVEPTAAPAAWPPPSSSGVSGGGMLLLALATVAGGVLRFFL